MSDFKWAFIGAGGIARSTASAIVGSEHSLFSVYNRTQKRAEELAARFGARSCSSVADAIDGADAAFIALTHDKHVEYALKCIEAGVPVLVEKPLAVNARDARELVAASEAKGCYLCEGMWTVFAPATQSMCETVRSGRLGKVRDVEIAFTLPIGFFGSGRLLNPHTAGGALLDLGCYPVSMALALFGVPKRVACRAVLSGGVDVRDDIEFEYEGFTARLRSAFRSRFRDSVTVYGERGTLRANAFHSGGGFALTIDGKREKHEYKNARKNQFDVVAREIREGKTQSSLVPLAFSLRTLELLDECRAQIGLRYPFE